MNNFEAVVLIRPEIPSNVRSSCLENLEKIINEKSGKNINNEDWGLRYLSYKIDQYSKAFYNYYQKLSIQYLIVLRFYLPAQSYFSCVYFFVVV